MAGTGGRTKPRGKKEEIKTRNRTDFIREVSSYYKTQKKKWGAKGVSLEFSTRKRSGIAGGYKGEGKNKGRIMISIPNSKGWSDYYKSQGRPTNPVIEGKRIVRHELAHHRQRLKEDVGKSTDKNIHGPQWKRQVSQIGGKDRPSPKPKSKTSRTRQERKDALKRRRKSKGLGSGGNV